jgi:hypothetical protein
MTKEFAGLLAQVVPVLALAIGLELRSLAQRLKVGAAEYDQEMNEVWSDQVRSRIDEVKATLAAVRASGHKGRPEIRAYYRALRDFRALNPTSEVSQSGMLVMLIFALVVGQAYLAGVEFYALTVAAGVPYSSLMSVVMQDLMAQLRTVIDVAFLAPAVEAVYRAVVFVRPRRGERGKRLTTGVLSLASVVGLRIALGLLF